MTSNPMLKPRVIENIIEDYKPMTVQGAIDKTFLFLATVVLFGAFSWSLCLKGYMDKATIVMWASVVVGFILALVTSFKPHLSKITGTFYAICEGLFLGTISFMYNSLYEGIVVKAVAITLLALFTMLFLYKTKVIEATDTFKKTIITATGAIALYYFIAIVMGFFGHPVTVFNGGLIGIGISIVFCIVASLNFILDFDFIKKGSEGGAPDYFEWYCAFSLLVTLVWLYIEVLKLLAQLNRRN